MNNILVRYINLDRKPDRNISTLHKIKSLGFQEHNIKRFSAIDGRNLKSDLISKNYINNNCIINLQKSNKSIREGIIGCALSHYFLLEEIMTDSSISNDNIIFIFEDDFLINDELLASTSLSEILSEINEINDWDIMYLGGRFSTGYTINNSVLNHYSRLSLNIYQKLETKEWNSHKDRTTHNYIIKKSSAKKIIDLLNERFLFNEKDWKNEIPPIDCMINNLLDKIKICDYFPHLFYSQIDYDTDIQHNFKTINMNELK